MPHACCSRGETQPFEKCGPERSLGRKSLTAPPPTSAISHASCRLKPTRGAPSCTVLRGQAPGHRAGLRRAATESEAGDQMETQPPEETERRRSKPSSRDRQTKRNQVRCRGMSDSESAQPVGLGRSAEPRSGSSESPRINQAVNAGSWHGAEKSANVCVVNSCFLLPALGRAA